MQQAIVDSMWTANIFVDFIIEAFTKIKEWLGDFIGTIVLIIGELEIGIAIVELTFTVAWPVFDFVQVNLMDLAVLLKFNRLLCDQVYHSINNSRRHFYHNTQHLSIIQLKV